MKAKIANIGSRATSSQNKHAAKVSMGANKSIKTRGGRGSYEGYQYAMRADVQPKNAGYLNPRVQHARQQSRSPAHFGSPPGQLIGNVTRNPTAMTTLGAPMQGSARLLYERMKLNRI